jgi:3-deoxy-manno-octulosonate cytidylyltransferase (CMP-KDO synthetase)
MTFKVYIPARYASSRLPGKPLLEVGGKSILQHVYDNARASGAAEVVIATDDERIANAAAAFGGTVAMTSSAHISGTDRIAEAVAARGEAERTVIVNVQGDEPLLPAAVISQVAALIGAGDDIDIATICEPVEDPAAVTNPNIVKVVRGAGDRALYFSRAPIPYTRDGDINVAHYRRHVGIYAYRAGYLRRFVALPACELEQTECLEQLRALAHNAVVVAGDAVAHCGIGIDTPADFEQFRARWNDESE